MTSRLISRGVAIAVCMAALYFVPSGLPEFIVGRDLLEIAF